VTEVVWLTSSYPWPGDTVSGIFFRTQAQALARAGLSLGVVAPIPAVPWPLNHARRKWRNHALAPRTQQDGDVSIARPRFPNVPGQPSWARPDRFIAGAAWRTREQWLGARLVHGHYSIIGLAAERLAARAGVPYVLTFHGGDINWWPDLHPERREDLKACIRGAAAVYTVSGALKTIVGDLAGVDAFHLPLGVNHRAIDQAALPRLEARRALGLPEDRIMVLFVGRVVPVKGVPELVSAVLELGDPFTTVLVGPGHLTGLGMDDPRARGRLVYAGAQPHDQVIRYMAAADVLVLPSYGEGLPTVLVEAGSLALPVIASSVGGIPEILGDGRGTILPEVSAEAVRDALSAYATSQDAARAAGERLRAHVLSEYDVDVNAARLLASYRSIIDNRTY
jgi:teichuronic acid biosynthesis glycosyltransferase TuaC